MTRIDFYVLPEESREGPALTACKLCDKAVAQGRRVHVHAPDPAVADDVDRLLWTCRQGSFIAHERLSAGLAEPLPAVVIGAAEPGESHHDVLINLGPDVPSFFSRFERVLEIVHGDAPTRAHLRERFKFYRDRGYAMETHKLTAT